MKSNTRKILTIAALLAVVTTGCTLQKDESDPMKKKKALSQTSTIPADQPGVVGVPGALVPVRDGAIARIENTLENSVRSTAGNFNTAVGQFGGNLATTQNPRRATGAGDVPMIAYAACSDVNLNTYGVTGNSVAGARNALIAAGKRMVDRCLGGVSAQAPYSNQVTAEFTRLVDSIAGNQGQTVRISFNAVCIAATTFCTQYVGY